MAGAFLLSRRVGLFLCGIERPAQASARTMQPNPEAVSGNADHRRRLRRCQTVPTDEREGFTVPLVQALERGIDERAVKYRVAFLSRSSVVRLRTGLES